MAIHRSNSIKPEKIPWTFHPRVFTSLGKELVTNDLVALVELVKNAYDAFASRVDIRFIRKGKNGEDQLIEIQDDGQGMARKTIIDHWLTVGTPHKEENTSIRKGDKKRRVTGEKGLGRLSAARLGKKLSMYTKKSGEQCFRVDVDWEVLASATNLADCSAEIRTVGAPARLGDHGTLLQISELNMNWNFDLDSDLPNLRAELARFVPPFKKQTDFDIYLSLPKEEHRPVRIRPPKILSHPRYILKGEVNDKGELTVEYRYQNGKSGRRALGKMNLTEKELRLNKQSNGLTDKIGKLTLCGPFEFEFRVWDFDKESLLDLGRRFDLGNKVTYIRRQISDNPFSGLSLYRDGVLVLPKEIGADKQRSSGGSDWLGLGLRRVSRVGKRISANQMIGYVSISADDNIKLRDTADREGLVDNAASRQFRAFLFRIIEFLEQEREKDRTEPEHQEPPLQDLFATLKSTIFEKRIEDIEKRNGGWDEIREVVIDHTLQLRAAVDDIQQRFYYYSRLASVGSLAMLLQHEVGNKVFVISELNSYLRKNLDKILGLLFLPRRLELSESAVRSLQRLSDILSPLASRTFGTHRRNSILEQIIKDISEWHSKEFRRLGVRLRVNAEEEKTIVAMDPGELLPIIDNLTTNSLYWLAYVPVNEREILIEISHSRDETRAEVRFHDSGPGVEDAYNEKIFWPGVTKKEGGIGMGLTVASELVAQRNGKMYLIKPGKLNGASFGFDLPLVRKKQ